MRYMRCRCGVNEAWTSMGSPACRGCEACGTTLAESPDGHREPVPHDWREEWKINPVTGERHRERVCLRCMDSEVVTAETLADADAGS